MSSNTCNQRERSRESSGYDSKSDCEDIQEKAKQKEEEIKKQAKKLVKMIDCIMKCLDGHHNNFNVAKVIGSTAAALRGASTLLGVLFAPATGGASLAASAISFGSSISVFGGTVSGVASLSEYVITKDYLQTVDTRMKKLQDKIRQYKTLAENLARKGADISLLTGVAEAAIGWSVVKPGLELSQTLSVTAKTTDAAAKTVNTVTKVSVATESAKAAKSTAAAAKVAGKAAKAAKAAVGTGRSGASASKATLEVTSTTTAKTTGQTVAKGVGKGFILLNAILIPVSIYDMYQAATELSAGQGSSACPGLILLKEQLGEVAKGNFTSSV